jgi:hypothetical protein
LGDRRDALWEQKANGGGAGPLQAARPTRSQRAERATACSLRACSSGPITFELPHCRPTHSTQVQKAKKKAHICKQNDRSAMPASRFQLALVSNSGKTPRSISVGGGVGGMKRTFICPFPTPYLTRRQPMIVPQSISRDSSLPRTKCSIDI